MFSSDQRFLISGDEKEGLKNVLKLALDMNRNIDRISGMTKVMSYKEDPEDGLVLCTRSDIMNYTNIPFEMSLDSLTEFVWSWLKGETARQIQDKIGHYEGDGGVERGWEVHYPKNAGWSIAIAVKPAWTYYAK